MANAHTHSHDHSNQQRHPEIGENKTIDFSVPWVKVDAAYQQVLRKYQPHVKTDGFRKGKAPLKLVEQMVGLERLYQETAEKVLPEAYVEAVKKANAKPISDPEIHPTSLEMGKDWEFHAHIAEKPEVKLGKYQDVAKKAAKEFEKKQEEVKKDSKEEKPDEKAEATKIEDQKLNAMMAAIRDTVKPIIPELLIKQEAQYQLNQMSRQLQAYNIELKSYLASMGKNEAELEQEYIGRALATWQIEVIIDAIADDQKIEIGEKDIEEVITKSKTEADKVTETQRIQMKSMLRKQKVFDFMLTLAK
jgi:FKBP-type peptidyl-prolyl cis-trans isomerase (trigger factor)